MCEVGCLINMLFKEMMTGDEFLQTGFFLSREEVPLGFLCIGTVCYIL